MVDISTKNNNYILKEELKQIKRYFLFTPLDISVTGNKYVCVSPFKQVKDANDQDPLSPTQRQTFECVENVSLGTVVGQVKVAELEGQGQLNFQMVGGNVFSAYKVHNSSGVITTVMEVDYEEASSHELSITATLLGRQGRSR